MINGQSVASLPAAPQTPLNHRFGGILDARSELAIQPLGDTYMVAGNGTVRSLSVLPPGPPVTLVMLGNPTFAHSSRLLMPGSRSRTFTNGDALTLIPIGDGVWRCIGIRTSADDTFAGYINGLTLSNNASDATNDLDLASGQCADSSGSLLMKIAGPQTRQLDVAYGTGNGGRFDNAISDGTWHCFVIGNGLTTSWGLSKSVNPVGETNWPAGFTFYRHFASVLRESGALIGFTQNGNLFKRNVQVAIRNSTLTVTDALLDMKVPTGIRVAPLFIADIQLSSAGQGIQLISDGDQLTAQESCNRVAGTEYSVNVITGHWITNTAGQLRFTLLNGSGTLSFARLQGQGWIFSRGQ